MAHFSPVNGAFPHKDQIDRTCLVDSSKPANLKIERGHILVVNENGKFELAADATKGPLYFALQGYDNLQAAMAGTVGYSKGQVPGGKTAGEPAITGLSFQEHGNYQVDTYDHAATYKIGDKLTVKDGVFVKAGADDVAVATVYAAPARYYANDATRVPGWSTGNWINVLRVSL